MIKSISRNYQDFITFYGAYIAVTWNLEEIVEENDCSNLTESAAFDKNTFLNVAHALKL